MQTSQAIQPGLRGSVRALCAVALPVMLEQLGQIFLGAVDTYFAGRINDNAIAAINVSNMFTILFSAVFAALGIGVMVKISHALGEGNSRRGNHILRQAVLLGVGASLLIGALCMLFRKPFLEAAGARGEILEMSMVYYSVVCVPCIFMCLTMVLSNGLKAMQNTRTSMMAALTANVTNAVLDALFIQLGWGVFGLALATTLSRMLNLAILLALYLKGVGALKLDRTNWSFDPRLSGELLLYALPIMLTQLSTKLVNLLGGSLVLHLGDIYYITHSVAVQLDEFICTPMIGFEAAVASLVSNSLGAGNHRQAARFGFLSCGIAMAVMTVLGAFLALWAAPLASIFTPTTQIQYMVRDTLTFMAFFQWTSALAQVVISAVQGTGDSRTPFLVSLVGSFVLRLGFGYLMAYPFGLKLIGIWSGFVADFIFRGTILSFCFIRFSRHPRETKARS